MKLKELHIRNIASIERADIDFEKDLNDAITGDPASIFLISGDTGAGKSVILDSISMALYKKTPRIADVANASKNDYTDAEGEQIRVASIEQYTRLGISDKDESYSEVVFEGNDGRMYHARLTLGMKLGSKDKETGIRPIKHSKPTWEIRIDKGDWTKDSVEQTILDAIGLDFQQFGRMAMLAQGQFANFLTGDKKEREAILEQLTNTQHFTAYGEAINSLWKKAKTNQDRIQTIYDTEKPHTLSDEAVEQLTKEQQEGQKQLDIYDAKLKKFDEQLKLIEGILSKEKEQDQARQKVQELTIIISGDEYKNNKSLYSDWDATTNERHQLADLQRARRDEQTSKESLSQLQDKFNALSSDIIDRQAKTKAIEDAIQLNNEWIEKRKQHEDLFVKAREVEIKIGQYLEKVRKTDELAKGLKEEQGKTKSLLKAKSEAEENAKKAKDVVKAKENEIEELGNQRKALNPQAIDDQKSKKEAAKREIENIRKSYDDLETALKDANILREDIEKEKAQLSELKDASEKAEQVFLTKKTESEKADKLLTTMQMSIKDTLINLRHRLQEEQADTCPLCGQHIDYAHLNDDFNGVLTPLEDEQKRAAEAYQQATSQRDTARDSYKKFDGAHQIKAKNLKEADQKNDKAKEAIEAKAIAAGLNIQDPLIPQIEKLLGSLDEDITKLKAAQQEAEALQGKINALLEEKKPLDTLKSEAETAKTKAENAVNNNSETITRLDKEHKELTAECETIKSEISSQLSGYSDNWQTDIDNLLNKLKKDANEYNDHQKQLNDDSTKLESGTTLNNSLLQFSQSILTVCPEWKAEFDAKAYFCRDINREWADLLAEVTRLVSKIKDCKAVITSSTEGLTAYYQESGKTEKDLLMLIAQEPQVATARKFVVDTDSLLKSRNDAIVDAQKQIEVSLKALGLNERTELPDYQSVENEKNGTKALYDELFTNVVQIKGRLETHNNNIKRLKEIENDLAIAKQQFARWDKLNRIFGGTRFRTLVQTYILRPLLNNANIYLEQITDRYRLTCSEDNEQLSILVLDRYNKDQVRSVTVLSGGERFMISLALSLALSSLNRPDMNVNILFIDEGFGTLDEKSLDSVMQTLEKLQEIAGQTNRRVGIISHREELEERIPVKIQVVKKGEGRSMIEVTNA
ncbi:AAA family ATPase [Prevotella sp. tf2-5]|uniref:AAA family ATPase n=1 Tax=Prevotella sp. tf2-5 TaxID=1761889 RepID=UPI0008EA26A9|nr:SMC family ATPase [Prevotella sp. tf2-5]SFO65514.1 DNA repair exonuclease SbcCD ATPase subunit [Prevotella sp. tf2-5]